MILIFYFIILINLCIALHLKQDSVPFHSYGFIYQDLVPYVGKNYVKDNNTHYLFQLILDQKEFVLCLNELRKPTSLKISDSISHLDEIKLYYGRVCDINGSEVSGTIVQNFFHGYIQMMNETLYIEDINRYAVLKTECRNCHSVFYSSLNMTIENDIEPPKSLFHKNITAKSSPLTFFPPEKEEYFENIYCDLTVIIHQSYLSRCGSYMMCLAVIMRHINKLNKVLSDQVHENGKALIQYQISKVVRTGGNRYSDQSIKDPSLLIDKFSEYSQLYDTCSTGVYVYTDWGSSGIGVGYHGTADGVGICNNAAVYIVNGMDRYRVVSESRHMITTIHEIGHNLGSLHDPYPNCPSDCYPSTYVPLCSPSYNTNYVMQRIATDGHHINNYRFSPCSLKSIIELVNLPERRICLKKKKESVCGNGIVEPGEECDAGETEDICCGSPISIMPCKVVVGECSPSQGLCCNTRCHYSKNDEICRNESICTDTQRCNGFSAICPSTNSRNNGQICAPNAVVCFAGSCNGSICASLGKVNCKCNGEDECKICCRDSYNATCTALEDVSHETYIVPRDTSCQDDTGVCTEIGTCKKINKLILFLRKIKLLLSDVKDVRWKKFFKYRGDWVAIILLSCFLISSIFVLIVIQIKHLKKLKKVEFQSSVPH